MSRLISIAFSLFLVISTAATATLETTPADSLPAVTYILNINTGKFHDLQCRHADSISERNRQEYNGSRERLIEMGFVPCKVCNP